jgi:hypothetical protein
MKQIITILALTISASASAFWNNNNNNFGPWMEDNGIFGFNPYEWTDPEWYPQEMENFIDEFSGDDWGNFGGNNWNGYNPYMQNPMQNPYYNPYQGGGFNPNFNTGGMSFNPSFNTAPTGFNTNPNFAPRSPMSAPTK